MAREGRILRATRKAFMLGSTSGAAPAPKKFRTLIRVVAVKKDSVRILIPAWRPKTKVTIQKEVFPSSLQDNLSVNARYYALANLSSHSAEQIARSIAAIQSLPASQEHDNDHKGFNNILVSVPSSSLRARSATKQ